MRPRRPGYLPEFFPLCFHEMKAFLKICSMKYPDPIPLPDIVSSARSKRSQELARSIGRGISVRLLIILGEFIGVALFNSSAILLDALASLMDVVTSLALLVCIKLAEKPPDDDHPFGHGRYEPLAGLQLGLLMVIVGGGMFFQQLFQAISPSKTVLSPKAWIIPFIAVVLLEITYRVIMRSAKQTASAALAADAVHYRIDALNSGFAALALLCGVYLPEWSHTLDHFGALIIALLMVVIGLSAARNNVRQLMDHVPEERYFCLVREAAERVVGVKGSEKLRIQFFGPDAHVDIDIEVDPKLSVDFAHEISQKVRAEIQQSWPAVRDVIVHVEPFYAKEGKVWVNG